MVYDIIQTMDKVMLLVRDELDRVNSKISALEIKPEQIKKSMEDFLSSGSKRIRTLVTVLYLKANGCNNISDDSFDIITAGEIIHNASLLHDDVLDGAKIRRGKTSFCEEYTPHISILAGDYLLSIATEKLLGINNNEILQIFLKCTQKMCTAEINQFFLRGKLPAIDEYINICEGKTACLFEAIIKSCSIVEKINVSADFAMNFGILFQLKNDLTKTSEELDRQNKIFTPKDILGIEKTMDLIDNYFQKIRGDIRSLPDNIYKEGLEELLESL